MTDPNTLLPPPPSAALSPRPVDGKALFAKLPSRAALRAGQVQADARGTQTSYLYDPKNGLLQYVLVTWSNGLGTVIQSDTENQYSWTQAVFQENAAKQLFELTLSNRDGTLTTEYYNPAWTGDPLYEVQVTNADHSWSQTNYDPENQNTWLQEVALYTAAGVETQNTITLRNGSTEVQVFDQAHGDALQIDTTYAPGGTASQWVFDTAGANTWSKYHYDAAGTARVDQSLFYRDGHTEVLNWDVAHGDALQYDTTFATNGTAHQVATDTAGVNAWSTEITDWYTVGGQVSDQSFSERDGATNTNFYATNGILTANVTLGAGGEKATANYSGGVTTLQLYDEEGRRILVGYFSSGSSTTLVTAGQNWANAILSNISFQNYTDKWGNVTHAGPLAEASYYDATGDDEIREFNSDGTLKAVADDYKDGTSDITLFNIGHSSLSTFTADFNSSGNLQDAIETVGASGTPTTIVAVTAAQIRQSLQTPGTTTFIEHGIKLLLVNGGMSADGTVTSDIYWQNVTSGSTQTDGVHSVGTVVAGLPGTVEGGLIGASIGAAVGGHIGKDLGGELTSNQDIFAQEGGAAYNPNLTAPPSTVSLDLLQH